MKGTAGKEEVIHKYLGSRTGVIEEVPAHVIAEIGIIAEVESTSPTFVAGRL